MGDALLIKKNRPVTKLVEASYTRPNDATPYAAGDVVANSTSAAVALTFAGAARGAGLGGVIQAAIFVGSYAPSLKPDLELFLFDTAPTMQQDNAAWAPSDAEMLKCIGRIRFPPGLFVVCGANGIVDSDSLGKPFQCASASTDLYGVLVVRNAYIPTNNEVLAVRLFVIQD
jgi:hypothetical protein